ncbi:hypothetical protein COMNV_00734 [Commensalibacter sp. Nvir]|uniref:helix-turn-helix domain-containing protein n=1 Tax=Commensalibacter sp. Nvir TaxID=3069817 RepID=UPI002D41CD9B|nr:hypothetical protein COMNV_00734 [Commensalibacter sp. Nvir]
MNNFVDSVTFLSMTLNERLKTLRLNRNLGQADVAAIVDVSIPTVSEWETGRKNPNRKKLIILADYYGVTLDYLIQGIETKELSKNEELILDLYRRAPDDIKGAVFTVLNSSIKK